MQDSVIKTQGLSKIYNQKKCVNNLNLNIRKGQIYGFLGPNGAGKSTTMKMLLGLVKPSEGEVEIFGEKFSDKTRSEILRKTGSIIESPGCYGHLTGWENMKIVQSFLGVSDSYLERALKIVRLDQQKDKKVKEYSLGMKQRLAIAMALARNPELLILDEPTNGLDPAGTQEIRELLKEMAHKHGITVMISSHLLSEIEKVADHVGIINDGNLIFQGSIKKLKNLMRPSTLIKTDNNAKALQVLEQFSPELKDEEILIKSSDAEFRALINKYLVNQGIGVFELTEEKINLEDLFLNLTKDSTAL